MNQPINPDPIKTFFIGTIAGCKLFVEVPSIAQIDLFQDAKKLLGDNMYIYFDGEEDGHRPEFFDKHPHLINFKLNTHHEKTTD